jgi:type III pantothenate kinase
LILELDIGNTRCKWRLAGAEDARAGACAVDELAAALAELPERAAIARVRAGCVRGPQVEAVVREAVHEVLGLETAFARSQAVAAGVRNAYAQPQRLGVDRWLAMLAGFAEVGGAVCVLDCGSAITADLVDAGGDHRGGYIAPGLAMMRASLLAATDRVRFEAAAAATGAAPGRDTAEAVGGGTLLAAAGFLRAARERFEQACPGAAVLLTGGDAGAIAACLDFPLRIRPQLVLDGLGRALP